MPAGLAAAPRPRQLSKVRICYFLWIIRPGVTRLSPAAAIGYPTAVGRELLSSGRVIALGRLLLAALSLAAMLIDPGHPLRSETVTYGLLIGYTVFAAAIVAATWHNWWFDAQSA